MNTATAGIIFKISSQDLVINYSCNTPQVSYSIADFGGNVIKRGSYNCIENNTLGIEDLPKGMYTLCIIDGDQLSQARFQKN